MAGGFVEVHTLQSNKLVPGLLEVLPVVVAGPHYGVIEL
jgi:hypothetical protein